MGKPTITSSVQIEECADCGSRNILDAYNRDANRCGDCGSKSVAYRVVYTGPVGLRCVDCDGDAGTAMVERDPDLGLGPVDPCPKCGGNRIQYAPTDEDGFPIFGEPRAA
jgi:hypothetical protein